MITWVQYYKLKPLEPLFSEFKNNWFIVHAICETNTTKVVQSCPPSIWGNFEQKGILQLEKTFRISLARTVTIFDMNKSNRCFCIIPGHVGHIAWICWTFRPTFLHIPGHTWSSSSCFLYDECCGVSIFFAFAILISNFNFISNYL